MQMQTLLNSLITKEYDITCLLDGNYYTGLNEDQIKAKYHQRINLTLIQSIKRSDF
jgi:hypothetical protein